MSTIQPIPQAPRVLYNCHETIMDEIVYSMMVIAGVEDVDFILEHLNIYHRPPNGDKPSIGGIEGKFKVDGDISRILTLLGFESTVREPSGDFEFNSTGIPLFPKVEVKTFLPQTDEFMKISNSGINEYENIHAHNMFSGKISFDNGEVIIEMDLYLNFGINDYGDIDHNSSFTMSIEIPEALMDTSLLDGVPSFLSEIPDKLSEFKHDPSLECTDFSKETLIMHLEP